MITPRDFSTPRVPPNSPFEQRKEPPIGKNEAYEIRTIFAEIGVLFDQYNKILNGCEYPRNELYSLIKSNIERITVLEESLLKVAPENLRALLLEKNVKNIKSSFLELKDQSKELYSTLQPIYTSIQLLKHDYNELGIQEVDFQDEKKLKIIDKNLKEIGELESSFSKIKNKHPLLLKEVRVGLIEIKRKFQQAKSLTEKAFSNADVKLLEDLGKNEFDGSKNKKNLEELFVKLLRNEVAYEQMMKLAKNENLKTEYKIDPQLVMMFADFILNSMQRDQALNSIKKAEVLLEKSVLNEEIPDSEKLTLKELGLLSNLAKNKAFDIIDGFKLTSDEEVQDLIEVRERAQLVLGQIEHILSLYSNYKPGDLFFHDQRKEAKYHGLDAPIDVPLNEVFSGVRVLYKDEEEEKLSSSNKAEDDLEIDARVTHSSYRFDPVILLKNEEEIQTLLDEMYASKGKDCNSELRALYQQIQNKTYQQKSSLKQEATGVFILRSIESTLNQLSENVTKALTNYLINEKGWSKEDTIKVGVHFDLPDFADESSCKSANEIWHKMAYSKGFQRIDYSPLLQQLIRREDLNIDQSENEIATISGYNPGESRKEKLERKDLKGQELILLSSKNRIPNPSLRDKWYFSENNQTLFNREIMRLTISKDPKNNIYSVIKDRLDEDSQLRDHWESKLKMMPSKFRDHVLRNYDPDSLEPISGGSGGVYVMTGKDGKRYIVKPLNESALCIHANGTGSPFSGNENMELRVKRSIPLYQTALTEVLASKVAEKLGFHIATPSELIILESEKFHHVLDNIEEMKEEKRKETLARLGMNEGKIDKRKLCSVQPFIENSIDMTDYAFLVARREKYEDLTWERTDALSGLMDPNDVEEYVLFCGVIGETDGNLGNTRLYEKSANKFGDKIRGFEQTDKGLSFPENNSELSNSAEGLSHMDRLVSSERKEQFLEMTDEILEDIANLMREYGKSEDSISAFKERIHTIKKLIGLDKTLREINKEVVKKDKKVKARRKLADEEAEPDLLNEEFGTSVVADKPSLLDQEFSTSVATDE